MPDSKELLEMLRRGAFAQEILAHMQVPPSRLKRMLAGSRLRKALKLEAQIAAVGAAHQTATAVQRAADRLESLVDCDHEETARKASTHLLEEGLRRACRPDVQTLGLTLADLVKLGKLPGHVLLYERNMTLEDKEAVIAKALQQAAQEHEDAALGA